MDLSEVKEIIVKERYAWRRRKKGFEEIKLIKGNENNSQIEDALQEVDKMLDMLDTVIDLIDKEMAKND